MTQIKKLSKLFLILTVGLLVACSSDDSSSSNSFETDIIGTWELLSLTANGVDLLQNEECFSTLTFTSSTLVSTDYFDNEDGNGCVVDDISAPGTYSISGNMLTGTVDGETITFEIIQLNSTTLKLEAAITEEGQTFTLVQTFKKL